MKGRTLLIGTGCAAAVVGAATIVIVVRRIRNRQKLEAARARWEKAGENVVVLHQFPRPEKCLSASPFVMKLEAFFRMAGYKYVTDHEFPLSPFTGKSPWVTLNGEELHDSQLIVEALTRKFGKDCNSHLAPKEKSVSRSFRLMLEDHFHWCLFADRWVNRDGRDMHKLYGAIEGLGSSGCPFHMMSGTLHRMKGQAYGQGVARLGRGSVQKMGIEDLEAISTFLGAKSFVMGGEKPSEIDAVLFAFVACLVYTSAADGGDGGVFKTLVEKRLTNLNQHMLRLKNRLFPDWDDILSGKQPSSGEKESNAKKTPPPKPEPPKAQTNSTSSPAAAAAKKQNIAKK